MPQRPYVVLGTLRDQVLYPTWAQLVEQPAGPAGPDSTHAAAAEAEAVGTSATAAAAAATDAAGSNGVSGSEPGGAEAASSSSDGSSSSSSGGKRSVDGSGSARRPLPSDAELRAALREVQLGPLLDRINGNLDAVADWASTLSLGEQQRLAFARVILAKVRRGREGSTAQLRCLLHACLPLHRPAGACIGARTPVALSPWDGHLALRCHAAVLQPRLVLMDESTSALDTRNERLLYEALRAAGGWTPGWRAGGTTLVNLGGMGIGERALRC